MASLAALRDALPRRLPAEFGYLASAARPFPAAPNGSAVRRAPNLLITGCGRSGTHALASLLRRHGVQAKHEGRGSEATLGWPYAGRALDWRPLWPVAWADFARFMAGWGHQDWRRDPYTALMVREAIASL